MPVGAWHCHYCDQAFKNDYVEELRRDSADTLLFARPDDPFHPGVAEPLAQVCRRAHIAQRVAREQAREQGQAFEPTRHHNVAEEFINEGMPDASKSARRRLRRMAQRFWVHPMQPEWYQTEQQLRSGERRRLAVPPVEYRWGLIGAYHDRVGHAGISQTLTAMRCHFTWPGIKADVTAYVKQCHACQKSRLQANTVPEPQRVRMSAPFEHVHLDLAGPFPVAQIRDQLGQTVQPRRGQRSTQQTGTAYVLLIVDYFTKAAEFVAIPNKQAATVARAFHDRWLMRYGVPEWATTDNGQEFGGAFRHQLERLGVRLVHSAPYHPQLN